MPRMLRSALLFSVFFFNDTATTEIYTLSLHDALPIFLQKTPICFDISLWEFLWPLMVGAELVMTKPGGHLDSEYVDRKSTRLNSSHDQISYAVFCLKKKKNQKPIRGSLWPPVDAPRLI